MLLPTRALVLLGLLVVLGLGRIAPGQSPPPSEKNPSSKEVLPSTAEYQNLSDKIKQLERELEQATREVDYSYAEYEATVVGEEVRVTATLTFKLTAERGMAPLAFRRAELLGLRHNGELPGVLKTPTGRVIPLHKPGEHEIKVTMVCPVREIAGAETGRVGWELDLPPAAIQKLVRLKLPPEAMDLQINGRSALVPDGEREAGLGEQQTLKVTWRKRPPMAEVATVRTALGLVDVRLTDSEVSASAFLTLSTRGAPTREWHLQVPPGAEVRVPSEMGGPTATVKRPDKNNPGHVVLTLSDATELPLTVRILSELPRKRNGATLPELGPFGVLGASVQSGTVRFHGAPDQWVRTDEAIANVRLLRREPTEEELAAHPDLLSVSDYMVRGELSEPPLRRSPWFRARVREVEGSLDARLTHRIRQSEVEEGKHQWRLSTTLETVPIQRGIEELKLRFPADWKHASETSPRPLDMVSVRKGAAEQGTLVLDLLEPEAKNLSIRIDAYQDVRPTQGDPPWSTVLSLPVPEEVRNRGKHRIILELPQMSLGAAQPSTPGLTLLRQNEHELVWEGESFPKEVRFRRRPWRPLQQADSLIDLTQRGNMLDVLHEIRYHGVTPTKEVVVLVPDAVSQAPFALRGQSIPLSRSIPEGRLYYFRPEPSAENRSQALLVLRYAIPMPAGKEEAWTVPLVRPVGATHGEIKVRAHAPHASDFELVGKEWSQLPLEKVGDRASLPLAVVRAGRPDADLRVRWRSAARAEQGTLIDRALYQVRVRANGIPEHRARFLLAHAPSTPPELILPPGALLRRLAFNGTEIPYESEPVGDERSSMVRLPEMEWSSAEPPVLEVLYEVRGRQSKAGWLTRSHLQPVRFRGVTLPYPVRWQVDLPEGSVPLSWSAGGRDWDWGLQDWLLGPRSAWSAGDLEAWFLREREVGEGSQVTPAFVFQQEQIGPLALSHVPKRAWLLFCSVCTLLLGLIVYFLTLGRADRGAGSRWTWPLLLLIPSSILVGCFLHAGLMASFFHGMQPGLIVLLLWIIAHQAGLGRFHRRSLFLPSFRRAEPGSSLNSDVKLRERTGSASGMRRGSSMESASTTSEPPNPQDPPPREPSTVDSPHPMTDE